MERPLGSDRLGSEAWHSSIPDVTFCLTSESFGVLMWKQNPEFVLLPTPSAQPWASGETVPAPEAKSRGCHGDSIPLVCGLCKHGQVAQSGQ